MVSFFCFILSLCVRMNEFLYVPVQSFVFLPMSQINALATYLSATCTSNLQHFINPNTFYNCINPDPSLASPLYLKNVFLD